MTKETKLIKKDCPMCFNSSGYTIYKGGYNQSCKDCNGTGLISQRKFSKLKSIYGNLISA